MKNDQLYTLNLTVVALVALVAIVGLTAIVLNGGASEAPALESQFSEGNSAGQVFYQDVVTLESSGAEDCRGEACDAKNPCCAGTKCMRGYCG